MGRVSFKTLRYGAFIFVALVVILYVFIQAEDLLGGPELTVTTPRNGEALKENLVHIDGVVANVSSLTLNDRSIVFDEKGGFSEPLLLAPGYNIIELSGVDRFGRSRTELLELLYN